MYESQENYNLEVRERLTQKFKHLAPEFTEKLTDRERLLAENAYRRGLYQGFFYALESVKENTLSSCEKFLYSKLFKWRYARHNGKFEAPPRMKWRAGK